MVLGTFCVESRMTLSSDFGLSELSFHDHEISLENCAILPSTKAAKFQKLKIEIEI